MGSMSPSEVLRANCCWMSWFDMTSPIWDTSRDAAQKSLAEGTVLLHGLTGVAHEVVGHSGQDQTPQRVLRGQHLAQTAGLVQTEEAVGGELADTPGVVLQHGVGHVIHA